MAQASSLSAWLKLLVCLFVCATEQQEPVSALRCDHEKIQTREAIGLHWSRAGFGSSLRQRHTVIDVTEIQVNFSACYSANVTMSVH